MSDTVALGHGDDDDVAAGRCCPTCRHLLTDHNTSVWNAGYATGARHATDGPTSLVIAGVRLHDSIWALGKQATDLPEPVLDAYGVLQSVLRREGGMP